MRITRKITTFLVAMFMTFTMATAQTVERNGVFSNMYIGINGGAVHNPVSNYDYFDFNTLTWNAGVELGKEVTPITGFSLQADVAPIHDETWMVSRVDVFGNTKFNLMNLFGGYKGYPRRFDIRTVTGIGWNHNFDDASNPNDLALQAGLEFDFNLGKNRNWCINLNPMVQANNILKNFSDIEPMVKSSDLKVNVGLAYRLGKGKQSHNFRIPDKAYTEEQYAALYTMYDECMSRQAKVDTVVVNIKKVDTVFVEKVVEVNTNSTILTFSKNSSVITAMEKQRLESFMANTNKDDSIIIVGSADTKTGTEQYNTNLAASRADAVRTILEKNGYTHVHVSTKMDAYNTVELSRCATIIRE